MKKLIIGLLLATALFAQDQTKNGSPITLGVTTLPASPTVATTKNMFVDYIVLVNKTASAVTVTIKDQSTNCSGAAACTLAPAVSVAANSVYSMPMLGMYAQGGLLWSASAANSIDVWVAGRY